MGLHARHEALVKNFGRKISCDYLGDQSEDGMIIFKWILEN